MHSRSPFYIAMLLAAPVLMPVFMGGIAFATDDSKSYHFQLSATGSDNPTIRGKTDIPNGTRLLVNVKKPRLADGQERIARGMAACGEDCYPATGPDHQFGIIVVVEDGRFSAGPFSFNGAPFKDDVYPVELSVIPDLKTATPEQIKGLSTPIYVGSLQIKADVEEPSPAVDGNLTRVLSFKGRCDFTLPELPTASCNPGVLFTLLRNGRSALLFTYTGNANQKTTFVLAGGHDRQPNPENYYLGIDRLETIFSNKKIIANKTEGECRFRLNESGSTYYDIRCVLYDRRNGIVFKFNLGSIEHFTSKALN